MKRHTFSPGMDETVRRFMGTVIDENNHLPGRIPRRFGKKSQRHHALLMMAKSLGIVPQEFRNDRELWGAIHEQIKGGVQTTRDTLIGDPWYLFGVATCEKDHAKHEMVAAIPSPHGGPIEQAEAEKMIGFLTADPRFRCCEVCRERCSTCGGWPVNMGETYPLCSADVTCPAWTGDLSFSMTRMSVFQTGRTVAPSPNRDWSQEDVDEWRQRLG